MPNTQVKSKRKVVMKIPSSDSLEENLHRVIHQKQQVVEEPMSSMMKMLLSNSNNLIRLIIVQILLNF